MKSYFAYIRVSTSKQGKQGSSLQEQRDAINAFASRHGLQIDAWFEDRETAAHVGRAEFSRMLAAVKKGRAIGVIFHKIDRSARNLKDWNVIQDLVEQGVSVRFTEESIDLASNEGRLTGDFLAVIAAHYIRNLRDEVRKGIRGRLKQGLYPLPAPLGYLDQGGGKPKVPDPLRAPFIQQAFELYSEATVSLQKLSEELHRRGLRSKIGKNVGVNRLSELLRNPFYVGLIRLKRSGETYQGIHQPIITKRVFEAVQAVLDGRMNTKARRHSLPYRRLIVCAGCRYHIIGETQKGHAYYRCHTPACRGSSVREEAISEAIIGSLTPLQLSGDEDAELRDMAIALESDRVRLRKETLQALNFQVTNLSNRLSKLTDVFLDGSIDQALFEERKLAILLERRGLEDRRQAVESGQQTFERDLSEYLELVKTLPLGYGLATPEERRQILKVVTSNLTLYEKNVVVELRSPFREMQKLSFVPTGAPLRDTHRTRVQRIFDILVRHCTAQAERSQRQAGTVRAAA